MTKSRKILIGIGVIWPFLYFAFFLIVILVTVLSVRDNPDSMPSTFPTVFFVIMPLHFLTIFLILGMTIFFIVNLFKNPNIPEDKRVVWAILLFLFGLFTMPVYWYLYIWKEPEAEFDGLTM